MRTVCQMTFNTDTGTRVFRVPEPRANLSAADARAAGTQMLNALIFERPQDVLRSLRRVDIVATTITTLFEAA